MGDGVFFCSSLHLLKTLTSRLGTGPFFVHLRITMHYLTHLQTRLGESSAERVNWAEGLPEAVHRYSERRSLRGAKRIKKESVFADSNNKFLKKIFNFSGSQKIAYIKQIKTRVLRSVLLYHDRKQERLIIWKNRNFTLQSYFLLYVW